MAGKGLKICCSTLQGIFYCKEFGALDSLDPRSRLRVMRSLVQFKSFAAAAA